MNKILVTLCRNIITICLFLLFPIYLSAQPCECTNCPLPITDNGSFSGYLDVTVDGPNDLGQCPLEQVCFTIDHTWIGDLSVSLTSPSGLNYLVMADANNASGGCGTNEDDLEVCVLLGDSTPLTGGTEYACNNGGVGPCLQGDWTVPCNVTDPFGGASPAPNCNLDDFNVPGDPANGTWALTVNDVCGADIGQLVTWSLVFSCGVVDCINCEADGGELSQSDVESCQFDPSLNLGITPIYNNGPPPSATEYGYAYVITDVATGIIQDFTFSSNFSTLAIGEYTVCGLSYVLSDAGVYPVYIGQPYTALSDDLNGASPSFCGDLSDDCFNLLIGPVPAPSTLEVDLCIGDCYNYNNVDYCNPGLYPVMLTSYLGCDSLVNLLISPLSDANVIIQGVVCPGEELDVAGVGYGPGNHYLNDIAVNGCDSNTTIIVSEFFVEAVAPQPQDITCTQPSVFLTNAGSFGSSFNWFDESGTLISTNPVVQVSEPGCYDLVVSRDSTGIFCSDTATVCVNEVITVPTQPTITGPDEICFGDTLTFTSTVDPDYIAFDWTYPPALTVLSGGDGFPSLVGVWTDPNPGDVCITVSDECGPAQPECISVDFSIALDAPDLSGLDQVCPGDTAVYTGLLTSTTDFVWTLIGDGNIIAGAGTDSVTVVWGNSGGGQLCVAGVSDCGNGPTDCMNVQIIPAPASPILNGVNTFCDQDTLIFTAEATDGLSQGFSWQVPACMTIIGASDLDTLTAIVSSSCDLEQVCVVAEGACETSTATCLQLSEIPNVPVNAISGNDRVCLNETSIYQVTADAAVLDYIWNVTGGSILSGQGTSQIQVVWTDPLDGDVCLEVVGTCNSDQADCFNVFVVPELLTPEITGADVVCDGSIVNYTVNNADTLIQDFVWTSDCGVITSGQGTETIELDWTGCPLGGQVCVYGSGECSDSPLFCMDVEGGTIPGDPVISGADESCNSITETYCGTSSDASFYNWTVVGGVIDSDPALDCIDVTWTQGGAGQLCLTTTNGCGSSTETCFDVLLGDAPELPTVLGNTFSCFDTPQTYTYQINSNDIIAVEWDIPGACASIVGSSTTDTIDVNWLSAGSCDVCVRVSNECGFGPWICETVEVQSMPIVDAGSAGEVCGLLSQLDAQVDTGLVQWTATGPGLVNFSDENDVSTSVEVTEAGLYTFVIVSDILGCTNTDTTTIQFNEEPLDSGVVDYLCDNTAEQYQVQIELVAGTGPFTVSGIAGTWAGSVFTSDPILNGDSYSFEVLDANLCGPVLFSGSYSCPCLTAVGQLEDISYQLCEDESITVNAPTGTVLDANDIVSYLIHEANPDPSDLTVGLISESAIGTISLGSGMNVNQTYYITAAAGNDLGGLVDLTDPCLSWSNSIPFEFEALPEAIFTSSSMSICVGDTAVVGLNILYTDCAEIILDMGNGLVSNMPCVMQGSEVAFEGYTPGTYQITLISVENENGCFNTSGSVFELTVEETAFVSVEPSASVCNSTDTGSSTQIDLSNSIISANGPLTWTNIDNCPFTGTLPNIDLEGVAPGDYVIGVDIDPGSSSCFSGTQYITLTVENCVCPVLDVSIPATQCNGFAELNLDDLLVDPTVSVEWAILLNPPVGGYTAASLNGSSLSLTNAAPGTYQLGLSYTDPAPVGCVLTNSLDVDLSDQLESGEALDPIKFCAESSAVVNLIDLLVNQDAGGTWSEISLVPSNGGAFNASTGTFNIDNQSVGTYTFEYFVNSSAPCSDNATAVTVIIDELPVIDITSTGTLTCTDPIGTLSSIPDPSYVYEWTLNSNVVSDSYTFDIDAGGLYELTVTDVNSSCSSTSSIVVDVAQDIPDLTLLTDQLKCHNDQDGAIIVESVSGGSGPYMFSLEGGVLTSDTIFSGLSAGEYVVQVEDVNGCVATASATLVNPSPLALETYLDYSVFENGFIGVGDSILIETVINTDIVNITDVQWTPSEVFSCDTCLTVYAYPQQSMTASLFIEVGTCSVTDILELLVKKEYEVFVPNIFSVNGDGINDQLVIYAGSEVESILDFQIYDRWGGSVFTQKLFAPNDPSLGWDGRINGAIANVGVYTYFIDVLFVDGHIEQFKGSVTITK